MTNQPTTGALAAARKPVTVDQIIAVVDELANVSTPTPSSTIVRLGLITELRAELRPSLGSTGSGRGGGQRLPIDLGALKVWDDVTGRVQALHLDIDPDQPARTGSLEQILNAWARDLVAADIDARAAQANAHVPVIGLNQDALRVMHHRVSRIRDRIRDHFNPAPHGDIPNAQCPACGADVAYVEEDGQTVQMPAIGYRKPDTGLVVECRNPECLATWSGYEELRILEHQVIIFRAYFTTTAHSNGSTT